MDRRPRNSPVALTLTNVISFSLEHEESRMDLKAIFFFILTLYLVPLYDNPRNHHETSKFFFSFSRQQFPQTAISNPSRSRR